MRYYHLPHVESWLREALIVFVVLTALLGLIALSIPLQ